jgi:hypothetical protein
MRRRDAQAHPADRVHMCPRPWYQAQHGNPAGRGYTDRNVFSCAHKTPGGIRWRVFAICEWHLRADLVLLSACQTPIGRGMRRRSFYPGAPERIHASCSAALAAWKSMHQNPPLERSLPLDSLPQGDCWLALWRIQSACRTGTRAEVFADPTRPAREVIACRL